MRMRFISVFAFIAFLLGGGINSDVVAASRGATCAELTIEEIATILRKKGHEATIERLQGRMPRVNSRFKGISTTIVAYCSEQGTGPCSVIQFVAEMADGKQPVEWEQLNEFNRKIGYVKLTKEKNSKIKMEWRIYIREISKNHFSEIVFRWNDSLLKYRNFMQ